MRLLGGLLLAGTFGAGLLLSAGMIELALANAVLFLVFALLAFKFVPAKFGRRGKAVGLICAFLLSAGWPLIFVASHIFENPECIFAECELTVTFELPPDDKGQEP